MAYEILKYKNVKWETDAIETALDKGVNSIDLLGYLIISLPRFTSKFLLYFQCNPVFYLRFRGVKFFSIPFTFIALIDNGFARGIDRVYHDASGHVYGWRCLRSRIYLKVAFGTKRAKIIDTVHAIPPTPRNIKKHIMGIVGRFTGFAPIHIDQKYYNNARYN